MCVYSDSGIPGAMELSVNKSELDGKLLNAIVLSVNSAILSLFKGKIHRLKQILVQGIYLDSRNVYIPRTLRFLLSFIHKTES